MGPGSYSRIDVAGSLSEISQWVRTWPTPFRVMSPRSSKCRWAHSAQRHNRSGLSIEHPGQGQARGKVLFPVGFRSTAAAVPAACATVLFAAIGALAFAFTDFGKDGHVVSCADSILSARSLS